MTYRMSNFILFVALLVLDFSALVFVEVVGLFEKDTRPLSEVVDLVNQSLGDANQILKQQSGQLKIRKAKVTLHGVSSESEGEELYVIFNASNKRDAEDTSSITFLLSGDELVSKRQTKNYLDTSLSNTLTQAIVRTFRNLKVMPFELELHFAMSIEDENVGFQVFGMNENSRTSSKSVVHTIVLTME